MNPKLLIFDLDGTLIDSRADLTDGINHMRKQYALEPLPVETVSGYIGNGIRLLVQRSLQSTAVDLDEALRIYREYYYSHLTIHTTLYDGVKEGIPRLAAAGHTLALLTNKPGDPSREILKYFGLAGYFDAIIGGGDIEKLKPEPDGIFQCMEAAGMDSSHTWMIGDHYTDLLAAENAGIYSGFMEYGFGEHRGYDANRSFASFSALADFFTGQSDDLAAKKG